MLEITDVSGGYPGRDVLAGVSFSVAKGELFGILGPNGSGKTTLLKMMTGTLPASGGSIEIKGRPLAQYSSKELAKAAAVLPQMSSDTFSYTVKETVSLGRYAHQKSWLQSWSGEDEEAVCSAMKQTGVDIFAESLLQELSGGERQRVFLAQALAQQPEILFLDEPTNHLDLAYQKELLDLLARMARDCELTVISIFHDLNLASLYCDRLLLLDKGRVSAVGEPHEVLQEERIRHIYRTSVEKHAHPKVPKPHMILVPEASKEDDLPEIGPGCLKASEEMMVLTAPCYMKTLSSAVLGAGFGWYRTFVNRHVSKDYSCTDHKEEMAVYIASKGLVPSETVGMMTAVRMEDRAEGLYSGDGFSLYIAVTAGIGNAVDAVRSNEHSSRPLPGTINVWMFVNGRLAEEAFIQALMTATEAKAKALQELGVKDAVTGSIATGTSTDSMLIAATQKGAEIGYAGTITPLGKLIGTGVYACIKNAIQKSLQRKNAEGTRP